MFVMAVTMSMLEKKSNMKVFVIDRIDNYSYCDNYKAVIVAEDAFIVL